MKGWHLVHLLSPFYHWRKHLGEQHAGLLGATVPFGPHSQLVLKQSTVVDASAIATASKQGWTERKVARLRHDRLRHDRGRCC